MITDVRAPEALVPADARRLPLDDLADRPAGVWRYREVLPVDGRAISLGEGGTALVRERRDSFDLRLKLEFTSPTLSFKDRGAVTVVARALDEGAERVVIDSSGNAGTAVAAYAARAGLACEVFVPEATSPGKLAALDAHGAVVHRVPGPRAAAARAAMQAVEEGRGRYASHVFDAAFVHGVKTFAYEVWEQLDRRAPDVLVLPLGNGTLLLGAVLGFRELEAASLVERVPRVVAVQARACAPIAAAFSRDAQGVDEVEPAPTVAEGIAVAAPPRGAEILAAIRETGGEVLTVDDHRVLAARDRLAQRGLYVEPTGAAAFAVASDEIIDARGPVVVPLCGAGLKAPH